ncbi:MAG: CCA tRNA nucleotidyltransferase [Microthrixaceae bacterium]|nr:CCA tRNA nucleotidyltransferase [Microthrixaceae bacterium]
MPSEVVLPSALTPVIEECAGLGRAFSEAGARLFLVGGIVRDAFEGRTLDDPDVDFTTDALPQQIRSLVAPFASALWTQGERFGTIGLQVGARLVEITTHRSEIYRSDSRQPVVEFSREVEADLARRDFTVNAMAVEVTGPARLIDPFGGLADLRARRLRTPIGAGVSFSDDPLRMLRAARFIAGYGLEPDADVAAAVATMADRLAIVSVERSREELAKLLAVDDPRPGLWFLQRSGLLAMLVPELGDADAEGGFDHVARVANEPMRRLATLLAPLGTRTRAAATLRALRCSNEVVATVSMTVGALALVWEMGECPSAGALRRCSVAVPDMDALLDVAAALASTPQRRAIVDAVRAGVAQLAATEDLAHPEPALDGDAVMALLSVGPGRAVGEAIAFLRERRLDDGPRSAAEETALLLEWAANRSP